MQVAHGSAGIAFYAPMLYTALCVMFLMRADPLRRQVRGGWALEIESFLGPENSSSCSKDGNGKKESKCVLE